MLLLFLQQRAGWLLFPQVQHTGMRLCSACSSACKAQCLIRSDMSSAWLAGTGVILVVVCLKAQGSRLKLQGIVAGWCETGRPRGPGAPASNSTRPRSSAALTCSPSAAASWPPCSPPSSSSRCCPRCGWPLLCAISGLHLAHLDIAYMAPVNSVHRIDVKVVPC